VTETYLPSDHAFSQFLSRMTPHKVLADRPPMFSKSEKQIDRFFRQGVEIAEADEMEIELQVWRRVA
jgi:hypothetical protein